LRDHELEDDFEADHDCDQQRDPPVASTVSESDDGDGQRDRADDLGLAAQGDHRRGEVEP